MSDTSVTIFTLFYVVISVCFVLKTSEFVSAGLTVESLFEWLLKSEHENFMLYHIKRATLTFLIHSLLPLVYVVGVTNIADTENLIATNYQVTKLFWTTFKCFSVILPSFALIAILYWKRNHWENHPIVKSLKVFCTDRTWTTLSSEINAEYRSIDKVVLHPSSVTTIVATDNWLMKVSLYNLNIAHESLFILCSTDEHHLSREGTGLVQFVNVIVSSFCPGAKLFRLRCTTQDFREIRDKLRWPVSTLPGITFHKTKIEEFTDVFKETISLNPPYTLPAEQELETCIGCMLTTSDVKIYKQCTGNCSKCFCRPLWCSDCMAKWFASRQEQERPETWLSSNCTCPVCRSVFCILDVCPVELTDS